VTVIHRYETCCSIRFWTSFFHIYYDSDLLVSVRLYLNTDVSIMDTVPYIFVELSMNILPQDSFRLGVKHFVINITIMAVMRICELRVTLAPLNFSS
jgi:hypothetical protein